MTHLQLPGEAWRPVIPSHFLRDSDNIVAAFTKGQELAIWRSRDGAVQAWENRCPHRGTRLTLGRIIDDRLSCAYHGWEFSANGGKCATIPAHPNTPAPKQLCVKTFVASEAEGMVWVGYGQPPLVQQIDLEPKNAERAFVRTLGLRANLDTVVNGLTTQGLAAASPFAWQGQLSSYPVIVFVTEASENLTFAHVWLEEAITQPESLPGVFAALSRFRDGVEAAVPARS